jgi:uncharacterized protein HemX
MNFQVCGSGKESGKMEVNFEMINAVMQWIVLPIAGVVVYMFNKQNNHHTDIAVLKSLQEATKTSHDREMKEMKTTIAAIFTKLDNIEQALRK